MTNFSYFSDNQKTENYQNGSEDAFELEACEPPQTEPERTEYLEGYAEGIDDWVELSYLRGYN